MAVISVKETRRQRTGTSNAQHRSYVRVYRVVFNSPVGAESLALTADDGNTSIPAQASIHDSDEFARVVSKNAASRGDKGEIYDVTVTWDTDYTRSGFRLSGGGGQASFNEPPSFVENPLNRPPEVTFRNDITQEEVAIDINDRRIVNSANRLFDPSPLRDVSRYTWVVTRNQGQLDVTALYGLNNTLNSAAVTIGNKVHDPGTLKLTISTNGYQYDGTIGFWPITYEFQYDPLGWQPKIINRGWVVYDNAVDRNHVDPEIFEDGVAKRRPPSEPVLLASDGTQLQKDQPHTIAVTQPEGGYSGGDPFETYSKLDLNSLGFGPLFSSDLFTS